MALPAAVAAGAGTVTHLDGVLMATHVDGSQKLLGVASEVEQGDLLITQKNTFARLKFSDGGEIVLRPNTEFKVTAYSYDQAAPATGSSTFNLIKGGLRAVTGLIAKSRKDNYRLDTPTATIGIRGTHFGVLFCQDNCADVPGISGHAPVNGLHVDVVQGSIAVNNAGGQLVVNAGSFGYVKTPNTPPVEVPPSEGVRITMPPSISSNDGGGIGNANSKQCTVQ